VKEAVKKLDTLKEFFIPEGCHIIELSNSPDDPDISIARARVEPGVSTRWHRLSGTTERYVILKGKGLVEVGNLPPKELDVGDLVLIPPMCRQRITNIGRDDLIFLTICTPRFLKEVYEEIEWI
jgi:mannose-6-phosphate isomerase-like protein (cupin superfamily)